MKIKKNKITFFTSICLIFLLLNFLLNINVYATTENEIFQSNSSDLTIYEPEKIQTRATQMSNIAGKEYFIKNRYTGQYLDVAGGVAADRTNVQQYKYNGTDSQRWYIKDNGDSTISIYTRLGNNGTYQYALDINDGSPDNYANVQIYKINGTDAQKFKLGINSYQTSVKKSKDFSQ